LQPHGGAEVVYPEGFGREVIIVGQDNLRSLADLDHSHRAPLFNALFENREGAGHERVGGRGDLDSDSGQIGKAPGWGRGAPRPSQAGSRNTRELQERSSAETIRSFAAIQSIHGGIMPCSAAESTNLTCLKCCPAFLTIHPFNGEAEYAHSKNMWFQTTAPGSVAIISIEEPSSESAAWKHRNGRGAKMRLI
jgi:hypothetical protein